MEGGHCEHEKYHDHLICGASLCLLAEDPCQGGTRFLVIQKNCLKVRLQLVFGHKLLQGEVISSEALE